MPLELHFSHEIPPGILNVHPSITIRQVVGEALRPGELPTIEALRDRVIFPSLVVQLSRDTSDMVPRDRAGAAGGAGKGAGGARSGTRNFLLWRVEYADPPNPGGEEGVSAAKLNAEEGAMGDVVRRCSNCAASMHVLAFKRPSGTPGGHPATQFGVPVAGFVNRHADTQAIVDTLGGLDDVNAYLNDGADEAFNPKMTNNGDLYAGQLSEQKFPTVAFGALGPMGRRVFSVMLCCNSHHHKSRRFCLAVQHVVLNANNEVVKVDEARSAPLKVVSKLLDRKQVFVGQPMRAPLAPGFVPSMGYGFPMPYPFMQMPMMTPPGMDMLGRPAPGLGSPRSPALVQMVPPRPDSSDSSASDGAHGQPPHPPRTGGDGQAGVDEASYLRERFFRRALGTGPRGGAGAGGGAGEVAMAQMVSSPTGSPTLQRANGVPLAGMAGPASVLSSMAYHGVGAKGHAPPPPPSMAGGHMLAPDESAERPTKRARLNSGEAAATAMYTPGGQGVFQAYEPSHAPEPTAKEESLQAELRNAYSIIRQLQTQIETMQRGGMGPGGGPGGLSGGAGAASIQPSQPLLLGMPVPGPPPSSLYQR